MKKTYLLTLAFLLIIVYSCRKNYLNDLGVEASARGKFSVDDARSHVKALVKGEISYDGITPQKIVLSNGASGGNSRKTIKTGQKIFYPFWDRAMMARYKDDMDYVEVPIAISHKELRLYQFKGDNIKQKPDESVLRATFQRLVVYRNKKGQIGQRLLTYIPDKQYIREHGYELSTNTLQKLNRDFFGYIEYKNWSGAIVSILRIENGKVVKKYRFGSKDELKNKGTERNVVQASGGSGNPVTNSTFITTCEFECTPVYGTVCETIDDGNPNDETLNEVECTYGVTGEDCQVVCSTEEIPDPDPCPSGNCEPEEPCDDCGPCTDCSPDNDPPVAEIKNQLDSFPCAKNLVNQLTSLNTDISNLIKNSFGKNDKTNLILQPDPTLAGTNTDGQLKSASGYGNNYTYTIGFNPDVLSGASKEYMLVTMYHEAIHAYLAKKKRVLGDTEFNNQFNGLNVNGGRLIGVQDPAHWPMGYTNFINGMRDAILAFNPSFPPDRAYALAAGGVMTLTTAQSTINNQERNTSVPGYQGTKCP